MKVDAELGRKIQHHLEALGFHTPIDYRQLDEPEQSKIDQLVPHYTKIMQILGLDLTDDSLRDTPNRVAKMMVKELNWGLNPDLFPKCTAIENKMDAGMVIVRNIKTLSTCEHHLVTIDGHTTVAYIPDKKILGLSKINRIVDYFARRPQVQERLTNQIWHSLNYILGTDNIAVYIDAVHYCVRSRGVEDNNSRTITNKLGGAFLHDQSARTEFMSVARTSMGGL